ncbi:hypothetical protein ACFSL6_09025 [Paenibacillus thailandensis]|uniref:Uncharacterized protein n=1 Tax=Paenibacillus thailandensis TaxID=393250 RepID=A0ABW5QZ12_9BACL
MKSNVDRITYYTRKAVQFSCIPFHLRKPGSLRFRRLMTYKEELNRRLFK